MVELVLTVSNIRLVGVTLDLELSSDDTLSRAMVGFDGKIDALVSFNCLLIHPGNREFILVELDNILIQRGQHIVEDIGEASFKFSSNAVWGADAFGSSFSEN
jgi:hypothetical protein